MSRNYELMTQLEIEVAAASKLALAKVDRVATMGVAPILFGDAENGEDEILRLIQRIFLSANGSAPRQVVLCGIDGENGSSSVCARAGRTLAANSSRPVCLVDANVRSPRLSRLCEVEGKNNPFCGPSAPLREQCVKIGGNLWLAGPNILADNSRVLLPPVQLKERLGELRNEFEYMLIDAPGTSVCGDAQLLGIVADAVILVIEANVTRRHTVRRAKESLDAAGVRLLGTVLRDRLFSIPERLYRKL